MDLLWDVLVGGVRPDTQCVDYMSWDRNKVELSIIFALNLLFIMASSRRRLRISTGPVSQISHTKRLLLLVLLGVSFLREMWLKVQQRDLITAWMHCYTMAIFQIGSLIALPYPKCQPWIDWLTRAYMPHMIFALGAMVMPDFAARSHWMDFVNFYLNHILVLCIPVYILSHFNNGVDVFNTNHLLLSLPTFLTLSLISVTASFIAKTNINFSMCPGAVDNLWPFGGPLWRFKCLFAFIVIWFPVVNLAVKHSLSQIKSYKQVID